MAACRVVQQRGIGALSIRTVAEESGWSRGIIQLYFRNKEDLVQAALEVIAEQSEEVVAAATAGTSGLDQLHALLFTYARPNQKQRMVFSALEAFGVRAASDPALGDRYRRLHAKWQAETETYFRGLAEEGLLRSDIPTADLASAYYALAMGLSFQAYVDPRGQSRRKAEALIAAFITSISPVAEPAKAMTTSSSR